MIQLELFTNHRNSTPATLYKGWKAGNLHILTYIFNEGRGRKIKQMPSERSSTELTRCSKFKTVLLPPATKLGQGNIFRSVCQELCPQRGVSATNALPRDTPRADTPRNRHPLEKTPPPLEQCMLGDTGNKRALRILLECILV